MATISGKTLWLPFFVLGRLVIRGGFLFGGQTYMAKKNTKSTVSKSKASRKAARKAPAKQPIGRPAMFRTPEEMQAKIDEYFARCKPSFLMIDGEPALDNNGNPVVKENPPTVVGLALFLGFESRQSLYAYAKKPDFSYIIKTAVSRMEEYAERALFEKAKPTGSIFWLKNHGWTAEENRTVAVSQKSASSLVSFSLNELKNNYTSLL